MKLKHGLIRKNLLGRKVFYIGRGVITNCSSIPANYIRIPITFAKYAY